MKGIDAKEIQQLMVAPRATPNMVKNQQWPLPATLGDTPKVALDWTDFNAGIQAAGNQAVTEAAAENSNSGGKTDWLDTLNKSLSVGADLFSKYRSSGNPAAPAAPSGASSFPWLPVAGVGAGLVALVMINNNKK